MKFSTQLFGSLVVTCVLLGNVSGADSVIAGKVKGVVLEKHEFVLTENTGQDRTIKLAENVVINRGGRDFQSELKVDDIVCVYCDKNALVLTANYILVQEGESKNWTLAHGDVQSFDHEKKEITYLDDQGRDWTFSTIGVKVFVNRAESKVESIKIGEHVLALLQKAGDQTTLKSLFVNRK